MLSNTHLDKLAVFLFLDPLSLSHPSVCERASGAFPLWVAPVLLLCEELLLYLRIAIPSQPSQQGMSEPLRQIIKGMIHTKQIERIDKRAHDDDGGHLLVKILAEDAAWTP
jgi:hypothetical protein